MGSNLQYNKSQENAIPACFSSHLKEVKFFYNFGCLRKEEDLCLVNFILKNAKVLEQLQHIGLIPLPTEIQGHLLSFPKGSSVALVVFS